mmetsp:Transcript_71385/g.157701  ORF Transcript_71385/g.157701 Transcript_71385/m.157701 type:complete len:226 (+) Transcript_71385:96-773(+)
MQRLAHVEVPGTDLGLAITSTKTKASPSLLLSRTVWVFHDPRCLSLPHATVALTSIQQRFVVATFHNLSVLQDTNLIVGPDGAQTMGNGYDGPRGAQHPQGLLDLLLRLRVQRRGRFVQNHDGWIFHQTARDRQPLLFSPTQLQATFSHHGLVALGLLINEGVQLCVHRGFLDVLLRRLVHVSISQIVCNGGVKQHDILWNHPNGSSQALLTDFPNILSIHPDTS